jgi:CHAT domain-containing protein/uncharacterized protein HemY
MKFIFLFFISSLRLFTWAQDTSDYYGTADKLKKDNDLNNALEYYQKYIGQNEKSCGVKKAAALLEAGNINKALGKYQDAGALFDGGINCARKLRADSLLILLLGARSEIYAAFSNQDTSMLLARESLNIAEKCGSQTYKGIALEQVGIAYYFSGDLKNAFNFIDSAAGVNSSLNNYSLLNSNLNNLGTVCLARNQYDKALKFLESALALARKLKEETNESAILSNIAMVYNCWGNHEKAILFLEKEVKRSKDLGQVDITARKLSNLGILYDEISCYDKAIECYREALAIFESEGNNEMLPTVFHSIGQIYSEKGIHDTAISYYQKGLKIDLESGVARHIAAVCNALGYEYIETGEYEKAGKYFNDALTVMRNEPESIEYAAVSENLARLNFLKGNLAGAAELQEKAVKTFENIRNTATGPERMNYMNMQIASYQALIRYYIKQHRNYDALSIEELSSARYLSELLGGKGENEAMPPAELKKFISSLDPKTAIIFLGDEDHKSEISQFLLKRDSLTAFSKSVSDLTGMLDDDLKAEISGYNDTVFSNNGKNEIKLSYIMLYYKHLLSEMNPGIAQIKSQKKLGHILYNFLFDVMEEQISRVENIVIIPGSDFSLIPIEACLTRDNKYMVEKYNISYVPSIKVSQLIAGRNYSDTRKPVLALGGAVYNSGMVNNLRGGANKQVYNREKKYSMTVNVNANLREIYSSLGYSEFSELPSSLTEAVTIEKILNGGRVITGSQANETVIKELSQSGELKNYKALHFATHSIIIPQAAELSALVLSHAKENEEDDGYLCLSEISDLQINADLVCLSACETGIGKLYYGEGMVGLTSAFFAAGANSVAATLWEIEDKSTMEFMTGMYRLAAAKQYSYSKAVNNMKRTFIKSEQYSSPCFWAPFIYWGN